VSSLGYVPFQGPTAATTQDYRNLYRVQLLDCARGSFCSSHVCAQGAKANPLTSVHPALARQPTFELRPLCNVLRVNADSTGKQATGVTYIDARGNEVEQPASIVVLGAYCFSNTRLLLLLSGIGTPYDPRTGIGVVGRNYSYQQGSSVHAFFDDREFNPFIGGGQLNASIDELNDRPRPARLHRRRLCQHLGARRGADQGQGGAAGHALQLHPSRACRYLASDTVSGQRHRSYPSLA
jgi:gluconate 2-dehydrogenase alpha chain